MGGTRVSGLSHSTAWRSSATGLPTNCIEIGVLGPRPVERAVVGKDYNKGTRVRKITVQAMWRLSATTFGLYGREGQRTETKSREDRSDKQRGGFLKLLDPVSSDRLRTALYSLITIKKKTNPNLEYWWQYMEMVCILPPFVRAQREKIWDLHLFAF